MSFWVSFYSAVFILRKFRRLIFKVLSPGWFQKPPGEKGFWWYLMSRAFCLSHHCPPNCHPLRLLPSLKKYSCDALEITIFQGRKFLKRLPSVSLSPFHQPLKPEHVVAEWGWFGGSWGIMSLMTSPCSWTALTPIYLKLQLFCSSPKKILCFILLISKLGKQTKVC